jgi:hypothetical protein
MEEKKSTLEGLQRLDLEHPEYGLGPKVQQARNDYNSSFRQVERVEMQLKEKESELVGINAQLHKNNAEVKHRNNLYTTKRDAIVSRVLDKRVNELKVSKRVSAEAVVACGNESVRVCRERAKSQAQRNASESGSVVLIDSMTQIENFKLSKDEVRSEVSARLSDIQVLEKGWITDESYRVKISAIVTPAITANLRNEIKGNIQGELDALVRGYAPVGSFGNSYVPAQEKSVDEEQQHQESVTRQRERYEAVEPQEEPVQSRPQPVEEEPKPQTTKPAEEEGGSRRRRLIGNF